MLNRYGRFDRGDHILVIDAVTGRKWKEPKNEPGTLKKAANFTKAAARHVRKGRPKVSLDVIQSRFEICQGCDLFVQLAPESVPKSLKEVGTVGRCTHTDCGCFLHSADKFPNKLQWGSTKCPKGNWGE